MERYIYKFLANFTPLFLNDRLRVLAYHEVPEKKQFEKQITYLKSRFNVIDIHQLRSYFFEEKDLPKKPLLLTFDDGDYSNFTNAFPILKSHKLPAVVFIISELINSNNTFWCRWVETVFKDQGKRYLDARKEVNRLKKISNKERVKALSRLPVVKSRQLSVDEIKEMEKHDVIMANHTHSHPMIDKCTDEEISNEMDEVRRKFKKWGLTGYPYFAYPNGNFDSRAEKVLISKGIELSFLFDHNLNKKDINPLRISRIRVNADAEINEFKVKVSGLHTKMMRLKDKFLR